jgi:hypothetical protein
MRRQFEVWYRLFERVEWSCYPQVADYLRLSPIYLEWILGAFAHDHPAGRASLDTVSILRSEHLL